MLDISLFEFETHFTLEQDTNFYDEEYGNNRYRITDDKSFIEICAMLNRFNTSMEEK